MNITLYTVLMIMFSVILIVGLILLYHGLTDHNLVQPQTAVPTVPAAPLPDVAEQEAQIPFSDAEEHAAVPENPVITEPAEFEIDFSLYDANGNSYQLSDFAGKPLVVNLWATWCGPCQMELPYFNMQSFNYDGQVQFLMVDLVDGSNETAEGAQQFVQNNGYSFPLYFTESDLFDITGQQYIPATLFISPTGELVSMHIGSFSEPELITEIEALLNH